MPVAPSCVHSMYSILKNSGLFCRTNWRAFSKSSRPLSYYSPRWNNPTEGFKFRRSSDKSFAQELERPPVLKPLFYCIAVSGLTLLVAAECTNSSTDAWTRRVTSASAWTGLFGGPISNADLRTARRTELLQFLKNGMTKVQGFFGEEPGILKAAILSSYLTLAQKWLDEGIWVAWQIPRLRGEMMRNFMHDPLSGKSHTLLTSIFSHKHFLHLLFNNLALGGFGSLVCWWFTEKADQSTSGLRESTSMYHFFSFFISAGLFSSYLAHVVRVRFYYPRLVAQISSAEAAATAAIASGKPAVVAAAATFPPILPSLGASGAIWGCVSLTALACPEARASLIFPSSISFSLPTGAACFLALDVLGILRGWRMFDHWAHLGGAIFGALYYRFGIPVWEETRIRMKELAG
ncbi:hypothetical protein BU17DRAFT_91319 [Hysterangium stoloniferum]|nr:hypothetical protein BU17DRAFT_91319 [Hysterangium stoloniferum]